MLIGPWGPWGAWEAPFGADRGRIGFGLKGLTEPLDETRVMTNGIPVCIECGGPVNALNEDESGAPCPACAERLLETLPGVFHAPWGEESAEGEPRRILEGSGLNDEEANAGGSGPSAAGRGGDSFGEPRGSA